MKKLIAILMALTLLLGAVALAESTEPWTFSGAVETTEAEDTAASDAEAAAATEAAVDTTAETAAAAEDVPLVDEKPEDVWNPDQEDEGGLWSMTDMETCKGGEALRELFERAVADMPGVSYTPAALLATKNDNGSNYCILAYCEYTDSDVRENGWSLVYVNEVFGGEVQVTNVVDIDVTALEDYGILH